MGMMLQRELTEIRRMILALGATVEQRLAIAVESIVDRDFSAAEKVRHGDRQIDEKEVEIEEHCLRILALTQPVASDLRFILAVLRINQDLERIGDLVKSISKRMLDLRTAPFLDMPEALRAMAHAAREMVADTLSSLADEDSARARRVRRADQRLDDLQKEIFAWIHIEIPAHVEATQSAIDILSIARTLERIGDLATSIAEDVIFLVEGRIVRHTAE